MAVITATPIPQMIQQKLSARIGHELKGDIVDNGVIRYSIDSFENLIDTMQEISDILHEYYTPDDISYTFTFRFNNEDNRHYLYIEELSDDEDIDF